MTLDDSIRVPGSVENQDIQPATVSTEKPVVRAYIDGKGFEEYPIETEYQGTGDVGDQIQKALDAGAAKIQIVAKGLWRFDESFTIPSGQKTVIFEGVGDGKGGGLGTALSYKGSGTCFDGVTNDGNMVFRDLWIAGPDSTGTTVGIASTGSVLFDNVTVGGFGTGWNPQDGTYYTAAINSSFSNNGTGVAGGANTMVFLNSVFNLNDVDGIRTENTVRSLEINHCSIEKNGEWGVKVTNTNSAPVGPVNITNSYIERNAYDTATTGDHGGVLIDGNVQSARVVGNYFNNHFDGACHIRFAESDRGFVGYNLGQDTITGTTPVGLDITANAHELQVAANEERRLSTATTPISDSGTRTLFGGIGENAGDPRSTGEWSFHNHPGVSVIDTTNGGLYVWSRTNGGFEPA